MRWNIIEELGNYKFVKVEGSRELDRSIPIPAFVSFMMHEEESGKDRMPVSEYEMLRKSYIESEKRNRRTDELISVVDNLLDRFRRPPVFY